MHIAIYKSLDKNNSLNTQIMSMTATYSPARPLPLQASLNVYITFYNSGMTDTHTYTHTLVSGQCQATLQSAGSPFLQAILGSHQSALCASDQSFLVN